MAMDPEEFESRVKRLEGYAHAHPAAYRLRVALFAGLGYAYLFFALGVLLLAAAVLLLVVRSGNLGVVGWAVPLCLLIAAVLRAFWVKMPVPEGIPLNPSVSPQLFATLDEIRARVGAPAPHTVLLSFDFNAGITHRSRLGIFGWPERFLLLGYPLMQALTPEQFRAVVAHEFGHLSGDHGRFASWIYRIRQTWIQLLEQFKKRRHRGAGIFTRFSEWYAPRFNAYSFVLARAHEYEADRAAANVTSNQIVAESLVALEMRQQFLMESFWPSLWKQASENPEPPADAVTNVGRVLVNPLREEDASRWLTLGFNRRTNFVDTHPALADRIAALGVDRSTLRSAAGAVTETAADRYLGASASRMLATLNAGWKNKVTPQWHGLFAHLHEVRQNLAALEERGQGAPLSEEERWNRARWIMELKGNETAEPLLREILAAAPEHASANYSLARILLARNDATGVEYMQRAMNRDPLCVAAGNRLLSGFYALRGLSMEADECQKHALAQEKILAVAERERKRVGYKDGFDPHALPPERLLPFLARFTPSAAVAQAWLVRKRVQFLPERPFYVLGILRHTSWFEAHPQKRSQELASQLAKQLRTEGKLLVLVFTGRSKWKKAFARVPAAEIYVRKK